MVYSEGPSVDPEFILYSEAGGKEREVFREFGLSLRLPGDDFVYVSGYTNDFFDKTRKFARSEVCGPARALALTLAVLSFLPLAAFAGECPPEGEAWVRGLVGEWSVIGGKGAKGRAGRSWSLSSTDAGRSRLTEGANDDE